MTTTKQTKKSKQEKTRRNKLAVNKLANWLFPYGLCQLMGAFLIVASIYSLSMGFEIISGNSILTTVISTITQTEATSSSVYSPHTTTSISASSCSTHPCTLTMVLSETIAVNPVLAGYFTTTQISIYSTALDIFAMLSGFVLLLAPRLELFKSKSALGTNTKKITLREIVTMVMSALVGAEFDKLIPTHAWWTHLIAIGVVIFIALLIFAKLG